MFEIKEILKNENCQIENFSKGDFVYKEGWETDGIYLLTKGKIKVLGNYQNKSALLFMLLESPNLFGLTSFFENGKQYQYSVQVYSSEACLFKISTELFNRLMENKQIRKEIIASLCNRIDFIEKRRTYKNHDNYQTRLLDILIFYSNFHIRKVKDRKQIIFIDFTSSEIAQMLNVTIKNVRFFLHHLELEKILCHKNGGIEIIAYNSLIKLRQKF